MIGVFCIKDLKADSFLVPFVQRSIPEATRGFSVAASEGDSMIAKFPEDFKLFHIADFDENTGEFKVFESPADLGTASAWKRGVKSVQ